jgi:hypothetical protein
MTWRHTLKYAAVFFAIVALGSAIAWLRRGEGGPREMPKELQQHWYGIIPSF